MPGTDAPTLSIGVPIYRRQGGRLSFLPAGHTDRVYIEVNSSKRIDIDFQEDLAAIYGVKLPFTAEGIAVAAKSAMFGLRITGGPDRKAPFGAAPDAPPPPPKPRKGRTKK